MSSLPNLSSSVQKPVPTKLVLPQGIGGNVHSELIGADKLKPLFSWVRFDVRGMTTSVGQAAAFYKKAGLFVVWLCESLDDINLVYQSGLRNQCIEAINEPDGAISGHPYLNPDQLTAFLEKSYAMCQKLGFTMMAPSLGTWSEWYFLRLAYLGGLNHTDAISLHPYQIRTQTDLHNVTQIIKQAIPDKPLVYTEYSVTQDPNQEFAPASLAQMIRQSLADNVPFCVYDIPWTDPRFSLLDADGNKTAIYQALEADLGTTSTTNN